MVNGVFKKNPRIWTRLYLLIGKVAMASASRTQLRATRI